ncbi:MAG: hypothetical protein DDT30_01009 [Dehalococcoidia bacterium]|nr:hypothetical protein [Bacillota bacterium]MBT9142500.1 hypothetical protein [Bacillota bacterium]
MESGFSKKGKTGIPNQNLYKSRTTTGATCGTNERVPRKGIRTTEQKRADYEGNN